MKYKILLAEDDLDIVKILKLYLENENTEVVSVTNGLDAYNYVILNKVNLAILDIMMPKLNGLELTKKIRQQNNVPIIILSAKNLDEDKVLGLNLGADDYITKPFNPLEVVARVNAVLRRFYNLGTRSDSNKSSITHYGDLVINSDSFTVTRSEKDIILTPIEFRILQLLIKNAGRVYTKSQIYEHVIGEYFETDNNTLMAHISNLRNKLGDSSKNPKYIKTIRGLGYKVEKN
ncbi:response regulator transcription factor [Clostridium sp. 'deep sea']|uniref:response regulator transcription factor n=1 Tax=Clostridium sp. 'deep sea' TaxID=2779445 RepID=UPI001896463A|nr:response regulator transcription factor [Clostridium sp. 'deep sea']QOR34927.1 response regulator transcription factor [Clostridium sp. 'deep sea']